MKTLRVGGWVVALLFVGLVASNVLWPAVARAQFAASGGGGTVDVLAALLGKSVTATSFIATAASGATGVGCQSNGCRIDFGAGADDYCESNGNTLSCPASLALGNGKSLTLRTIGNQASNPVQFVSAGGVQFFPLALPGTACGSGTIGEGTLQMTPASTGVATKVCVCTKNAAAAFVWRNIDTATEGTSTTCPV